MISGSRPGQQVSLHLSLSVSINLQVKEGGGGCGDCMCICFVFGFICSWPLHHQHRLKQLMSTILNAFTLVAVATVCSLKHNRLTKSFKPHAQTDHKRATPHKTILKQLEKTPLN